ncbi:hypothetical protein Hanom_Chr08g00699301 [Helianthus anomalus]
MKMISSDLVTNYDQFIRNADMLFGGITIVGGVKGTSATDFIINRMSSNDNCFSHVVLLLIFQLFV